MALPGIDYKRFKKIGESKQFTTLKHPAGHEIKIAHAALPLAHRKELSAMPLVADKKMATGGEVGGLDAYVADKKVEQDKENRKRMDAGEPQQDYSEDVKDAMSRATDMTPEHKAEGGLVGMANSQNQAADLKENYNGSKHKKKYADGGDVQASNADDSPDQIIQDAAAIQNPQVAVAGVNQAPQYDMLGNQVGQAPVSAPQAAPSQPPQMPAQQPGAQDPYGTGAAYDAMATGLNQQQQGIGAQAQAQSEAGKAEADALQKQISDQQANLKSYKDHFDDLDRERQSRIEDIEKFAPDPNHYLDSMDTGKKIRTAIGLIIGGFGGPNNAALGMLKQNIQNDMEAQRMNLGKKENLLSANMRQYGNIKDASDMTRVTLNDIAANQIKLAAAKQATPMAQAAALQSIGKLNADNAAMIGQMSMRKTLLGGMQAGRVPPERVVNFLVPEKERPEALKELKEAQSTVSAKDNLLNSFDQVAKLNTVGNRMSSPVQSASQIAALRDPLIASLSKETAGRFTEQDAQYIAKLFPNATDNAHTVQMKRQQLNQIISQKMHFPSLSAYGINANDLGQHTVSGAQQFQHLPPKLGK